LGCLGAPPQTPLEAGPPDLHLFAKRRPPQESASFLKKNQKLLLIGARRSAALIRNNQKFFGSFFQKRTAFSPTAPGMTPPKRMPAPTLTHRRQPNNSHNQQRARELAKGK
jgi:hypothetical protein